MCIRELPNEKINEERMYQAEVGKVLQMLASKFFICPNQKSVSHVPGREGKRACLQ